MQAVVANNTCYILNPTFTTNPANSNSNKNPENFKINKPQHAHNTNTTCSKNTRTQAEHLLQWNQSKLNTQTIQGKQKHKLKNTRISITKTQPKRVHMLKPKINQNTIKQKKIIFCHGSKKNKAKRDNFLRHFSFIDSKSSNLKQREIES